MMGREARIDRETPKTLLSARAKERDRLKALASLVQSEAHWAKILKDMPTDDDREAMEQEVAPYLPWRRCGNKACETGDAGVWVPVLLLRAIPGGPTWRAQVLLKVCTACREKIRVEDVLTEDMRTRIAEGHEGSAKYPDWRLTTLTFDALQ